jgi:hypothetical protein
VTRTQRIEASYGNLFSRFDYYQTGKSVLGITKKDFFQLNKVRTSAMAIRMDDGFDTVSFVADLIVNVDLQNISAMLEFGKVFRPYKGSADFIGTRLSHNLFTFETYLVSDHKLPGKVTEKDAFYTWLAYHPEKFFSAIGWRNKEWWAMFGTKNGNRFGNFSFFSYHPSGNFWFRSQNGFHEINQNFFHQDLYLIAMSYLVVPPFFFKHFSPISTKGDYAFKLDAKRRSEIYNFEVIVSKKVGPDWFYVATGVNSEVRGDIMTVAPSVEFYKKIKTEYMEAGIEIRYDFLYKSLRSYLTVKF